LLPRERKTANCFEALEATHNRSSPDRPPTADQLQLYPEKVTLSCQATARPRNRCHRACKQPKPARSKATPVTKDNHYSDRCPRRVRHSQLNTTKSPVSKASTAPLLRLFSADAWKGKIHLSLEIFEQFFKAINAQLQLTQNEALLTTSLPLVARAPRQSPNTFPCLKRGSRHHLISGRTKPRGR
jgi:hypothetical protein